MLRVVLLGVVVVAVLRVVVDGGGEARLGAPLFFLFGVTADVIFLAQTRRARGGL